MGMVLYAPATAFMQGQFSATIWLIAACENVIIKLYVSETL